jgi:hypothetical protein
MTATHPQHSVPTRSILCCSPASGRIGSHLVIIPSRLLDAFGSRPVLTLTNGRAHVHVRLVVKCRCA